MHQQSYYMPSPVSALVLAWVTVFEQIYHHRI